MPVSAPLASRVTSRGRSGSTSYVRRCGSRPYAEPTRLTSRLSSGPLRNLSHLARLDPAADAALHGAAEASDLVREDVAGYHPDGAGRNGQEARAGRVAAVASPRQ